MKLKQTLMVGLCLTGTLTLFSFRSTTLNEANLGNAMLAQQYSAQLAADPEAARVVNFAKKVWERSGKEVAKEVARAIVYFLTGGATEPEQIAVASAAEIQLEIDAKMQTL